ncbi:MAG: CRISPR-associated protein (Cas_Cas02710) [Firmicutes bacterium ADurb.Bin419]|nr:MAG: CRISPR-associated protein (Cas_Cas02710) [Firmicutes bacterium ADurb.Bin419]
MWNYGVDTGNADYSKLNADENVLLEDINKIIRKIKGFNEWNKPDKKVSLLAGFIILAAVKDEIMRVKKPGKEIDSIYKLRNKVDARNKSIFAHGYEFIDRQKHNEFKEVVEEYMNLLCSIEGIDKDDMFSGCKFIKL